MNRDSIKINEKFRKLIPPLSTEEFRQLENNILEEGIRDPICIWGDIIIDGHNRFEIAQKHNLDFSIKEYSFDSEADVMEWMDKNQFGRRNLKPLHYKLLMGRLYNRRKSTVGGQLGNTNAGKNDSEISSDSIPTSHRIAEDFGVSYRTIEKAGLIQAQIKRLSETVDDSEYEIVDKLGSESKLFFCAKQIKDLTHNGSIRAVYRNTIFVKNYRLELNDQYRKRRIKTNSRLEHLDKKYSIIIVDFHVSSSTKDNSSNKDSSDSNYHLKLNDLTRLSLKSKANEECLFLIKTDPVSLN